ncbi:MAG: glycosyltransferase [Ferruginibacter sp.]
MMLWIVFIGATTLLLGYGILLWYYRKSWMAIVSFKNTTPIESLSTSISVIIPARNEADNIGKCLSAILNQQFPQQLLEIIVVDDFSEDDTATIVQQFNHPSVQLISLKNSLGSTPINAYKKKALEIGIQKASGKIIVTTDADCIAPPNWLNTIAAFYEQYQPAFIVMPVRFINGARALDIFQALDFMTLQGITGAAVHKKMHSMCNGANLAFTKNVFEEVGGYTGIDHIASGDDMLLMHKIYSRHPDKIQYLQSTEVIVDTLPAASLSAFFNQRIRWASKADQYEDKRITAVLVLVYLVNAVLLFMLSMAMFFAFQLDGQWALYTLMVLAFKTLVEYLFLIPVAAFFKQSALLWWFPLAQPFHILYTVIAGFLGKFGQYQWKQRKVK